MLPANRDRPLVALGLYALCLLWLLGRLPFWYDEVLQLTGTTQPSAGKLLAAMPAYAGQVPLG